MQKAPPNLFNDVEDTKLRNNNRAAIMANIFEDNILQGKRVTSAKGGAYIMSYFMLIPKVDRGSVCKLYRDMMSKRGFDYVGAV